MASYGKRNEAKDLLPELPDKNPFTERRLRAKGGRPKTQWPPEVEEEILWRLMQGEALGQICKDDHLPCEATVLGWLVDGERPEFVRDYALARKAQAERWVDQIIELADTPLPDEWTVQVLGDDGKYRELAPGTYKVKANHQCVARIQQQIDSRKWYASKVFPKVYGDAALQALQKQRQEREERPQTVFNVFIPSPSNGGANGGHDGRGQPPSNQWQQVPSHQPQGALIDAAAEQVDRDLDRVDSSERPATNRAAKPHREEG